MHELFEKLFDEDSETVEEALLKIGRVGQGDPGAMRALQEFLRREKQMPLRILATQTIAKIKKVSSPLTGSFKKPVVFQCPGAEKIKRVAIIDVTCPHCKNAGTASVAGFENEYSCESCRETVTRELPESCIEKCPVGSECVGEERYEKYMSGRSLANGQKLKQGGERDE